MTTDTELTEFDEEFHAPSTEFYVVTDPFTQRDYHIPDLSGNIDLIKAIQECNPRSPYPPEMKIASAALWCVLGSSVKVSKMLRIPDITIRSWYKEPWWHMAVREVRKTKNEEFDAKLTGLLDDTIVEIQDRLMNGETVVDKQGELKRVPVSTRNLATLLGIVYDKRALTRGDPTSKVVRVDVNEHLTDVAKKLSKMVDKIPTPMEPITVDGEFTQIED
jgi:hypothetical protein